MVRKLGQTRAWGLSWQGDDLIELDPRCRPKFFLSLCCHEFFHQVTDWPETKVDKTANKLADILWALGYKRVYDENKPMEPMRKKKKKSSE